MYLTDNGCDQVGECAMPGPGGMFRKDRRYGENAYYILQKSQRGIMSIEERLTKVGTRRWPWNIVAMSHKNP
jgi:hypothetical protein